MTHWFTHLDISFQLRGHLSFIFVEIVRAFTFVINQGWAMYWGTSRWSPTEIMVSLDRLLMHVVHSSILLCYEGIPSSILLMKHCFDLKYTIFILKQCKYILNVI